jgi:hypothetical protein
MPASAALLAVLLLVVAGCRGDDDSPERRRAVSATAREVATVVQALERATAAGDWDRICSDLFAGAVRAQAGGRGCPEMLARTARGVRDPRIEIEEVAVRGRRASVRVVTTAAGQARVRETLQLVREDGSWRIAALGTATR